MSKTNGLVSLKIAAEILGCGTSTLRTWDNNGTFKAVRTIGGQRRYRMEDLERFKRNCVLVICTVCGARGEATKKSLGPWTASPTNIVFPEGWTHAPESDSFPAGNESILKVRCHKHPVAS